MNGQLDNKEQRAIKDSANRLLSRRDYSVFEFKQKLTAKGFSTTAIENLVAELSEVNLLNDLRFAENFAAYQYRRGKGENWIRQALRQKGVEDTKIDLAFNNNFDWQEQILHLVKARNLTFDDIKQKSKSYRFLLSRGYTYEQIQNAVKDTNID